MAASNKPNSDVANELHDNKRSKFGVDEKLATSQKSKPTSLHYKPGSTDIKRSIYTALPRNPRTTTSGVQENTTTSTGTQVNETIVVEKDNKSTETYTATTTDTATITTPDLETGSVQTASASAELLTTADSSVIANTVPTNQTSPVPCTENSSSETKKKKSLNKKTTQGPNKTAKGKSDDTTSRASNVSHTTFTNSSCYSLNRNKVKLGKIKESTPVNNTRTLTYCNSNSSSFKAKERIAKRQQNKTNALAILATTKETKRITARAGLSINRNLETNKKTSKSKTSSSIVLLSEAAETATNLLGATIESETTVDNKVAEEVTVTLTETTETEIDTSTAPKITSRRCIRPFSLIPIRSRSVGSPSVAEAYAKLKALLPTPMEEDNNNNPNSKPNSGTNKQESNNNNNNENNSRVDNNQSNIQNTSATGTNDAANDQDENPSTSRPSRKRKINEENTSKTSEAAAAAAAAADPSTSTRATEEDDKDKEEDKDAKKKKNRCAECRKKVGLTGFECRCGGLYCAVHRYSDKHDCTFNYREHGAQEIRRNNPVVVGEKIQKI